MANNRKGPKGRSGKNAYEDYYEQENRRSSGNDRIQFHSYTGEAPRPQAGSRKSQPVKGKNSRRRAQGRRRRKNSRYRLAHPEKLLFMLGLLAVIVILLVILIRSAVGKPGQQTQEESSGPVQTVQSDESQGESGTLRSVNRSDLGGIPNQLAAYMASMVNVNPDNYKQKPTQQGSQGAVEGVASEDHYLFSVAIDAGHGGTDAGWEVGAAEKDITLAVAEKVNEYINQNAPEYHAFLIRGSDVVMSDQQRVTRAEQGYADLIVSIHCNGSELELGGTSAAYWTGEGDEDERAAVSQQLAEKLMSAAAEGFGMWERETRVEDNPLLHAQVPSVMVEMGYLTYGYDNELLQDEALQKEAATKIAQVLIDYMKEAAPVPEEGEPGAEDSSSSQPAEQ